MTDDPPRLPKDPYIMDWNISPLSGQRYPLSLKVRGGTPYPGQRDFSPKVGDCIKWNTPYNNILFETLDVEIYSGVDCKGEKLNSTTIKMETNKAGDTYPLDKNNILLLKYNKEKAWKEGYKNYFDVTSPSLAAGPPIITNEGWSNGQGNTDSKPTVGESFWVQDYGMDEPRRWTAGDGAIYQTTDDLLKPADPPPHNLGSRAYPIHIDTGAPTWKVSGGDGGAMPAAFEGLWQIDIKIGSDGRHDNPFCETFYLAERYDPHWGPGYYSDGAGGDYDYKHPENTPKKVPVWSTPTSPTGAYSREIDIMETKWQNGCPQINLQTTKAGGTSWNTTWKDGEGEKGWLDYGLPITPARPLGMPPWTEVGGAPTADFITFGCLIRRDPNPSNKPEREVGGNLWLYAYKPDNTQWYCTTAIPKLNSGYTQDHPFAAYIGTWCERANKKPGEFKTGYKNFIYLPANDPMITGKNPKDNPGVFGKALLRLYIVNYGTQPITKVVLPEKGGNGPPLKIGPKSFVEVSAQKVTGSLPWYIGSNAKDRPPLTKVAMLPAIISFATNLTAVAYRGTPSTLAGMNDILYVANYHDLKLTGHFVVPTGKNGFPLEIGPHSFVSVTTEQVGGSRPWYVATVQSGRPPQNEVTTLPAVFSFATNLTAVAYPAK
jgi:hypothetical protein